METPVRNITTSLLEKLREVIDPAASAWLGGAEWFVTN